MHFLVAGLLDQNNFFRHEDPYEEYLLDALSNLSNESTSGV